MTPTATRPNPATASDARAVFPALTDKPDPQEAIPPTYRHHPPHLSKKGWRIALKYLCLAPLFPMAGYLCMDQTGVSLFLIKSGVIPKAVLGEGFGHVGLCFSFHYVITAIKALLPPKSPNVPPGA